MPTFLATIISPLLLCLLLVMLAERISLVRGFAPSPILVGAPHHQMGSSSARRLFYQQESEEEVLNPADVDPKAPLTSFAPETFPKKYQLITPTEDTFELEDKQRLVCIGDVHGDYAALEEFLKLAQVYDGKKWTGGNTILVQCGDVLDRGSEELLCFSLLSKLSQQATDADGRVICLWGNHEALNAAGIFHYTTGDHEYEKAVGKDLDSTMQSNRWRLQFAGSQPVRRATFEPGGLLADPLMANLKVAVRVGKTVCVHAGLTTKHLQEWGGIEGINRMAHDYVQQARHGSNNNLGEYKTAEDVMIEAQARFDTAELPPCLGGGTGGDTPVWMRDYSVPPDTAPKNPIWGQLLVDDVLFELDADRMVVGHTVQARINAALGGKVWRVDVGASKGVNGGVPEVLEVVRNGDEEIVSILTRRCKLPAENRYVENMDNQQGVIPTWRVKFLESLSGGLVPSEMW